MKHKTGCKVENHNSRWLDREAVLLIGTSKEVWNYVITNVVNSTYILKKANGCNHCKWAAENRSIELIVLLNKLGIMLREANV